MMSSDTMLTDLQAREIQEQLFATYRQQTNRHVPVHLPRKDFWEMVKRLLTTLDVQIHNMIRKHGADLRVQNEQKRQANVRHIASELARRRLVAMMQHAASQSLRMATSATDNATVLPPLDWQKTDGAERQLYTAIQTEMDRFKKTIGWQEMQDGLRGEMDFAAPTHKPGTMQLGDFTEKPITNQAPPDLVFEDQRPEPLDTIDIDEEDRIAALEWDSMEQVPMPERDEENQTPPAPLPQAPSSEGRHSAAMELAPSATSVITDDWMDDTPPKEEEKVVETIPLIRIRILTSFDEAIATTDGSELMLQAGDVHNLETGMAQWLIDSGAAEAAPL
jgi:hypothetical protein